MTMMSRRSLVLSALGAAAAGVLAPAARAGQPLRVAPRGDTGFYAPSNDGFYREQPSWPEPSPSAPSRRGPARGDAAGLYGPLYDEPFPVPAVKTTSIGAEFLRQHVVFDSPQAPGTIIIDPGAHHLYFVIGDGTAMRYGVGVGRSGFGWSGEAMIREKREWPDWYPPKEMFERQPELLNKMQQLQSGIGMPGGPGNPLGARAMYLWQNNKDTLFRVHGTVEPWTIGRSVSSGCIRMINQDAIDLYDRVPIGARVVVLDTAGRRARARDGVI